MTPTRPLRERLQDAADDDRHTLSCGTRALLREALSRIEELTKERDEANEAVRVMQQPHSCARAESAEQQRDRYVEDWKQAVQALRAEESRRSDAEQQLAAERQARAERSPETRDQDR